MNTGCPTACRLAGLSTPAAWSSRGASALACVLAALTTTGAFADDPPFRFSKTIQPPPLDQEDLLSVTLDSDVYAATQDGLPDLRILDAGGDPVPFVIRPARTRSHTDTKQAYPPASVHVTQDAGAQQTHVVIATRGEPLTSLTVETPARNFSRNAMVQVEQVSGAERSWRTIGEATLTRFDFKDLRREQLSITFSEARQRRFRIVVENRDSPPLRITNVSAAGQRYETVFLAQPEMSYRLIYGRSRGEPADYDTATIEELLHSGHAPQRAALGEQQTHAKSAPEETSGWSDLLNNPPLLVGIMIVLVVLLAFGLIQAARRLEETPTS